MTISPLPINENKVYEWSVVQSRLSFHRKRLNISKPEMIAYIKRTYGVTFGQLTDGQVIELDKTLANTKDKTELLKP